MELCPVHPDTLDALDISDAIYFNRTQLTIALCIRTLLLESRVRVRAFTIQFFVVVVHPVNTTRHDKCQTKIDNHSTRTKRDFTRRVNIRRTHLETPRNLPFCDATICCRAVAEFLWLFHGEPASEGRKAREFLSTTLLFT
jgi:hypothetical protein